MQQTRVLRPLLTLTLAMSLTGCGVMFGGTTKNISITSAPSAATITTSPQTGTTTTPTTLSLERKNNYTLIATRDGYNEAQFQIRKSMRTGPLILDILFTGLLGVVVDWAIGGWWDLKPEDANITLERADDNADGPQLIQVSISSSEDDPGFLIVDATERVQIELIAH